MYESFEADVRVRRRSFKYRLANSYLHCLEDISSNNRVPGCSDAVT